MGNSFSYTAVPTEEDLEGYTKVKNGKYKGDWKEGKRHGKGVYVCNLPNRVGEYYEGDWENDIPHGKGLYKWINGNVYEGEVNNDRIGSYGILRFPDGSFYEGEFNNCTYEGKGIYTHKDGSTYNCEWKNNKREGNGIYTDTEGNVYECVFKDNHINGFGTCTNKYKDIILIGCWKNNVKEGYFVEYNLKDNTITRGNYVKGVKTGIFETVPIDKTTIKLYTDKEIKTFP